MTLARKSHVPPLTRPATAPASLLGGSLLVSALVQFSMSADSWAQSSSVVSQGFEGDMAAGAAGVVAAGEATQGWRGPISFQSMEGLWR